MTAIFDRRRLKSQIRIWRGDIPIGSGFVVGPRHVMTCAHVVADSAGRRAQLLGQANAPTDISVRMDMPVAPAQFFTGRVVADAWRPEVGGESEELDDIAVLELVDGELPPTAIAVGKTRQVGDGDWIVGYGVAAKLAAGVIIRGRFQGNLYNRFLIQADAVDEAVRPGCSGTAAWNSMLGGIAGMIAEMQQTQTGRVIPVDLLQQVWPLEWEDELAGAPLPPEPSTADLQLDGLNALAATRATRAIVLMYGDEIRSTSLCANVVGDLKRLHDLVDQLRRSAYTPLRSIMHRLPAPEAFRDVAQQRGVFLDIKRRIVAMSESPNFEKGLFPWVDEHLAYAAEDLKGALEEHREALVGSAVENLRPVVEVELTSLDSRIADATRRLNLAALTGNLRRLRTELSENMVGSPQIEALDRDIATLAQIELRVEMLIGLHHDWQRIDTGLNGLENALGQSMDYVANSLRFLSGRLAKACPADERDPGLAAALAALEAAIEAKDSTRAWIAFPDLATYLRDRFFAIDRDLLEECERIRLVGASLALVVEKLDASA